MQKHKVYRLVVDRQVKGLWLKFLLVELNSATCSEFCAEVSNIHITFCVCGLTFLTAQNKLNKTSNKTSTYTPDKGC